MNNKKYIGIKKSIIVGIVFLWMVVILFRVGGEVGGMIATVSVPFSLFLLMIVDYIIRESRALKKGKKKLRNNPVLKGWIGVMGIFAAGVMGWWIWTIIQTINGNI